MCNPGKSLCSELLFALSGGFTIFSNFEAWRKVCTGLGKVGSGLLLKFPSSTSYSSAFFFLLLKPFAKFPPPRPSPPPPPPPPPLKIFSHPSKFSSL